MMPRTSEDVLRSLKRYVAVALGDTFEVRLAREEGAFERPFARVVQAGAATYPSPQNKFLATTIQPFAVFVYPLRGTKPDDALLGAQAAETALYAAFLGGVELGRTLRMPLFNYEGVSLSEPGVWFPKDFVRISNVSTQPFVDDGDNLLYSVACDLRLTWRRTTAAVTSGLTPLHDPPGSNDPGGPPNGPPDGPPFTLDGPLLTEVDVKAVDPH